MSDLEQLSWDERFCRIELMLGSDACSRLRESWVTVVGLGAVGSYAVEGLARAGIGRLRLVDFDRVAPSNFNRQLYALESNLGKPKCEVGRVRVLEINPECRVEAIHGFVDAGNLSELVGETPSLVIDAIDALNPKVDLLEGLRTAGIPVISCLGAAMRSDASAVRVAPLDDVHNCPLGRVVRRRLRRRGVPTDFTCVFSNELLPRPLRLAGPADPRAENPLVQRGRERNTLGSLPTITGIFGLTAANTAIRMIAGGE